MKKIITLILFSLFSLVLIGQTYLINEGFESTTFPPTGWTNTTSGCIRTPNNFRTGAYCLGFNGINDAIYTPILPNPSVLSFWYKRSTNTAAWTLKVQISSNASTWQDIGTITNAGTAYTEFSFDLSAYQNIYVRLLDSRTTGTAERYVDDFTVTTGTSSEVTTPTLQASALTGTPSNTSMELQWTPGDGSFRIVKMNTVNTFSAPVDGTTYTANASYSGSGEQVIYNGATQIIEGNPFDGVSVDNLQPNTTYWFRAYEYNGVGSQTKYLVTSSTANPTSITTTNSQNTGYYNGISGYGSTLKSQLHTLLRTTHTTRYSYDALWTQLPYTDEDPANSSNLIEIYTGWSVPKSNYGGGTTEWNREHTWSKSHGDFGETAPAGTDLHHLRPCDSTVNSAKSNKDFDNGGTAYTDASPYPGYTGVTGCYTTASAWEPRNEDKGDVARMIMYMAVRYEGTDTSFNLEIIDDVNSEAGVSAPNYGKLSTLLAWHVQDPPDAREYQRNNRIAERQGNRNPFIDHPEFARYIWAPVPQAATSLNTTGFTANWSAPITATKYYLEVATDSLFTSYVTGYSSYDAGLTTSKVITGLTAGTYYYRLRSFFLTGYSMYSGFQKVMLIVPVATLSTTGSLEEGNLNGASLTISLSGCTFSDATLLLTNFALNGQPAGLSISGIQYVNSTTATVTLAFNNTDFDTNFSSLRIIISAVELSSGSSLNTSVLPVIAYVETPLTINIIGNQLRFNITSVSGAAQYRVYSASLPGGTYTNVTSSGTFTMGIPTQWNCTISESRRFFKAVAIKN